MKKFISMLAAIAVLFSLCSCGSAAKSSSETKAEPAVELMNASDISDRFDAYAKDAGDQVGAVIDGLNAIGYYDGIAQDAAVNDVMGIALDAKDKIREIYDLSKAVAPQDEFSEGYEDYYDAFKDLLGCALTFADKAKVFCKEPSADAAEAYEHYYDVYLAGLLNYSDAQAAYLSRFCAE